MLAKCGTALFYRNAEMLPEIVEVQSATLDDNATYLHTDGPLAEQKLRARAGSPM